MEKVTISKIQRFSADREGNPLKTSAGKPYTRVLIYSDKHDGAISGFENKTTQSWKEGDTVTIFVEKKGQYLNFKTPATEVSPEAFYKLRDEVRRLDDRVALLEAATGNGVSPEDGSQEYSPQDSDPELPF